MKHSLVTALSRNLLSEESSDAIGDVRPASGRIKQLLRRFNVSYLVPRRQIRDCSHGIKRKLGLIQALAYGVYAQDEPAYADRIKAFRLK